MLSNHRQAQCGPALAPLLLWANVVFVVAPLRAQTPATSAPQPVVQDALVAPVLKRFVPAVYPQAALDARVEGDVTLLLSVDANGRVSDAEVLQPAGHGFDEAARDACLAFELEPARRGQQPVAARIRYRYEFRLPIRESSTPASAAPAAAPEPRAITVPQRAAAPVMEVEVRGESTEDRVRNSAAAVVLLDAREAARHSADLGSFLGRTQGVSVTRSGAMGSEARVSLHGLSDDQVRLFLDGVPLEAAGYGFGIASVPLPWIERVAVYRGVVPHTLGADALGGAIDLVTHSPFGRDDVASATYTAGAFDTHSVSLRGHTGSERTGLWLRVLAHADTARNDYVVRARQPDELGRLHSVDARRYHDGYRALGGQLELGVRDKPWAQRLALRAFGTAFDKALQHNLNMSVPYGAVEYGQRALGVSVRYALPRIGGTALGVQLLASYSHRTLGFRDTSRWTYDWFGQRTYERPRGAGELSGFASDIVQWEDRALLRLQWQYGLGAGHLLRLSAAPDLAVRSGEERLRVDAARMDPLSSDRSAFQLVTGLEHALRDSADVLDNSLFVKHYFYRPASDQVETLEDTRRSLSDTMQRFGAGDALRLRLHRALVAKLSYEYATRLPRPDEAFGDGALTTPNLELTPETSHNGNLSLRLVAALPHRLGQLTVEAAGFVRRTSDLIVRLPAGDRVHGRFQNVVDVSTLGSDGALQWRSPGRRLGFDVNATWLDMRNASERGAFAPFYGQRMPNRPWLFANASWVLSAPSFAVERDELQLTFSTRYVHAFAPDWSGGDSGETIGAVPTQLVHDLSLVYSLRTSPAIDFALDLYNLSDARVFDAYGVQKPGRAAYFKVTVCWACVGASSTATATR